MDNMNWRCVFKNMDHIFFAYNDSSRVYISDGVKTIWEYSKENVTGCTCNGEMLWLSTRENNEIICIDLQGNERFFPIFFYDTVRIVSMITGQQEIMVLEGVHGDKAELFLFDGKNDRRLCILPINKKYIDFVCENNGKGFLLCEEFKAVPGRYADEIDDTEVLFFAEVVWDIENIYAEIVRSITLYIDNNYEYPERLIYGDNLRFPLFDYYLWKWLSIKSFSSSGRKIVYYCPDISGLIIAQPTGYIDYIFALPHDVAVERYQFLYDDIHDFLYIIKQNNEIIKCSIYCTDTEAVNDLNNTYNSAYKNKTNLQRRRDGGDFSFWSILNHAITSFHCEPVLESGLSGSGGKANDVYVTIETPVSGVLVLESSGKEVASFDNWNFRQRLLLHYKEDIFHLRFISSVGKKSEIINIKAIENDTFISISQVLSLEDIKSSCDRAAARIMLEKKPTNTFAANQLAYVGTIEDYNFMLAILEDYYCASKIHHGNDNENVTVCINTILRLAMGYHRKDAIPLLKNLLVMSDTPELTNTIREAYTRLSEATGPFWQDKPYRIDFHVQADGDISILDLENNIRFTYTVQDEQAMYCLRSATTRFMMQLEIESVILPFDLSVEYGKRHYLKVLFRECDNIQVSYQAEGNLLFLYSICKKDGTVVLTRYMGKPVKYNNMTVVPNKVQIPDFVFCIGNGAFKGAGVTEVAVSARLQSIGEEAFQYSELRKIIIPDSVTTIGAGAFKECKYLEEITIPHALNAVSDSMLEHTPIRKVEIPGTVYRIGENAFANCSLLTDVIIHEGVEVIAAGAFSGCKSLTTISIPLTVTSIESRAFDECTDVVIVGKRGSFVEKYAIRNNISFRNETDILNHSDSGNGLTTRGKIIIVSGPSAAGKGTVAKVLILENENYRGVVTATTRTLRAGEISAKDYIYFTDDEFEKRIQENSFFEYSQYGGNYYGTLKESVYSILKQGKNVILDVEFERALEIRKQNTDALLVYIMPPDAKTAIDRLNIREMNDKMVRNRLAVYAREAYSALRGDILLVNNDAKETAHILAALVENPKAAKELYEENVELVVALKKEIERYLEPPVHNEQELSIEKMIEYFRRFEEMVGDNFRRVEGMLGDIKETGDDTNNKVTSLVHFVETDLQAWIASNRPGVDNEALIEQFVHKATDYINTHTQASAQKAQEEERHLKDIFGDTWNRLLPTTKTSLISAGVLWKLCANISTIRFDYSGIIITATAALESELKKVFYIDFQKYMVAKYGDPSVQSADKTYSVWPERLLSKTKDEYDREVAIGSASLPQLADNFTMGTLPYMFKDRKNANQQTILRNRMKEYLRTIVNEKYYNAPLKAFNDYGDDNSFVNQCESIRVLYRNPAGHVDVLSRDSAEECYTRVVGVEKVDAFRYTYEIQGLIMILYSYLK